MVFFSLFRLGSGQGPSASDFKWRVLAQRLIEDCKQSIERCYNVLTNLKFIFDSLPKEQGSVNTYLGPLQELFSSSNLNNPLLCFLRDHNIQDSDVNLLCDGKGTNASDVPVNTIATVGVSNCIAHDGIRITPFLEASSSIYSDIPVLRFSNSANDIRICKASVDPDFIRTNTSDPHFPVAMKSCKVPDRVPLDYSGPNPYNISFYGISYNRTDFNTTSFNGTSATTCTSFSPTDSVTVDPRALPFVANNNITITNGDTILYQGQILPQDSSCYLLQTNLLTHLTSGTHFVPFVSCYGSDNGESVEIVIPDYATFHVRNTVFIWTSVTETPGLPYLDVDNDSGVVNQGIVAPFQQIPDFSSCGGDFTCGETVCSSACNGVMKVNDSALVGLFLFQAPDSPV